MNVRSWRPRKAPLAITVPTAAGKALGQPIHSLLGGQVRDKIKVYSWVGGDRSADVANNARDVVAEAAHTCRR